MAEVDKDVPEQQIALVAQWQAERANAVAYGDKGRVEKIDRQLADLGVKQKAAEKRAEAAKDEKDEEPQSRAPQKTASPSEHKSTR